MCGIATRAVAPMVSQCVQFSALLTTTLGIYSKIQVENMSEAVSPGNVELDGLVITSVEEVKRFLKE